MLLKLNVGVNIINILHKVFDGADLKSAKNTVKPSVLIFYAFGIFEHKSFK